MALKHIKPTDEQIRNLFRSISETGRIFSTEFVKRTDGSVRRMHCRTGVKRYTKGGSLKFSPKAKELLPVYDLRKREYRFVNLRELHWVKYGGVFYDLRKRRVPV